MTTKKKLGTKAKIRTKKKRERCIALLAFFLIVLIVSAYFSYKFLSLSQDQTINPTSSQLKAAIVDHLSLTFPNSTFTEIAKMVMKQAGYTVDYYSGEEVNVEFYREIPTHGYDLLILRVHSGLMRGSPTLGLFTSERYEQTKYIYEQLTDQLWGAVYSEEEREKEIIYFGISPLFIKYSMKGRFQNSIIIMMGCDGLTYTDMAEAFIEKGAKVYISWSGPVLGRHTDQATTHLLQHLIIEKQTIEKAVTKTTEKVGPDPEFRSLLLYFPLEVGNDAILSANQLYACLKAQQNIPEDKRGNEKDVV